MAFSPIYAIQGRHRQVTLLPYKQGVDDGSTLTLDFTTGVLDPRLTFTRTTNATFINSSGQVQWADSNLAVNSAFGGTSPGTGWTTNGSGSMSSNAGTFTAQVTSAATAFLSRIIAVSSGLRYSASVNVTTIIGTINYNEVITIGGTLSSAKFYRNGVEVGTNGSGVAQAQTGLITVIWTCGGTNTIRFGIGASGTNHTNVTVALDSPRVVPGEVTQATYFASTTTAEYHAPRFDYDPNTLAPRGLLIEGSASNLLTRSEALATSPWSAGSGSGGTVPTVTNNNDTAPDGNSTATRIELNITGGGFSRVQQPVTGTAGVAYTFSVWMKLKSGSTPVTVAIRIGADGTPGNTNRTVTSSWQRFQTTYTPSSTTADAQIMLWTTLSTSTTADVLVWGAQLETGSGASSYIPTGASTGNRQADNCELLDLTTMGFNASSGTIFVDMGARINTGSNRSYTFLPASGGNNQIFEGSGVAFQVFSGGSFVAQIGTSTSAAQKIASAYAVNDYAVSVNGGAVATDTSGALPTSLTKLTLGGSIINTAAYQFGCIRTFKYWPTRLPNAQLQSLTT